MSCDCETFPICVGGKNFNASLSYNARGQVQSAAYIDESLQRIVLTAGTFTFGSCPTPTNPSASIPDLFRVVQPLVAGNNIINHGLLLVSPAEVEVRNATTGSLITARVVAEAVGSVTLFVPVAVPSARISVDI